MSPTKTKTKPDDGVDGSGEAEEALKRLGGGRWQTRDERFTIEPQSGTWAVVDAHETDDFGLPLVRGPFKSLTDAKAAIGAARSDAPKPSPLAARLEAKTEARSAKPAEPAAAVAKPARTAAEKPRPEPAGPQPKAKPVRREPDEEPRDPAWFRDLDPADRGRARRLIDRLAADGLADAEGTVRRDLAGGVPALAAYAIAARLAALAEDAGPEDVAALLAEGRDEALGVRWRLVDGEGRPITLEPRRGRDRRKRSGARGTGS
jgi:hypothetical protein